MDSLLNLAGAVDLQSVTLLLAAVGFILTLIEILFPHAADRIEDVVDVLGNMYFLRRFMRFDLIVMGLGLAFIVLMTGFLVVLAITNLFSIGPKNMGAILQRVFLWSTGFLLAASLGLFLFRLAAKLLDLLNQMTNGRALGLLGLSLMILSLMVQLYPLVRL